MKRPQWRRVRRNGLFSQATKILVWNFTNFTLPNGMVHSSCTDPTQATAHLVIVLASRILKSSTGNNNFVKWKGTFWSDRPKWPDRSKWTTFKAGHEYSGWTKLKWSIPFDVHVQLFTNRNFWNFGFNGKHPLFTCV